MNIVPTKAIPSQVFTVTLGGQSCAIALYQKAPGMFLDLTAGGAPVVQGVLCHDRVRLVRQAYLGFIGDLAIIDTQGVLDPVYTGLGARFQLAYLTPADLP